MKIAVLLLFAAMYSQLLTAQDSTAGANGLPRHKAKIYFKFGFGYAATTMSNPNSGELTDMGTGPKFDVKSVSYSSGISGLIATGVNFTKNIGIETGLQLGLSNRKVVYDHKEYLARPEKITTHVQAPVLSINNVVLHSGGKKVDLYAKAGVVLPVATSLSEDRESSARSTIKIQKSYTYKMRFTLGYSAGIGVGFRLGKNTRLWAEANMLSFNPTIKEKVLTRSLVSGSSNIAPYSQEEKTTEFSFSGKAKQDPASLNYQHNAATYSVPFSNVGAQLGVAVNLGRTRNSQEYIPQHAMQRLYFKAGAGYGTPQTSIYGMVNGTFKREMYYSPDYSIQNYSVKPASYFAGITATLNGGYLVSKHIGVELAATVGASTTAYTYTSTTSGILSTIVSHTGTTSVTFDSVGTVESYAKVPMILIPSLVLQTGGKMWNLYLRTGMALPMRTKLVTISHQQYISNHYAFSNLETTTEYKTRFALGYSSAAGITCKLTQHLFLWTEANILSLAPYLKEGRVTKFEYNGTNLLPFNPSLQQYSFKASVQYNPYTELAPTPTHTVSFSTIGLQLGVGVAL